MPLQLPSDNIPSAPQCPLRVARVSLGITQMRLAILCEVTPQVILLSEQGCYIDPPVGLFHTLSDQAKHADWPAEALLTLTPSNYKAWQRRKREYNANNWEVDSVSDLYRVYCKGSASRLSKELLIPLRSAQDFVSGRSVGIVMEVANELGLRLH